MAGRGAVLPGVRAGFNGKIITQVRLLGLEGEAMLLEQEKEFQPIKLVLQTEDEAVAVWRALDLAATDGSGVSPNERKILVDMIGWFSTEAKI